jgi:hypothetical protein
MARRTDIPFLAAFGAGFWMVGAWILSKHGLDLPTRHPPEFLHLEGLSKVLFAGGPFLGGVALALASWRVYRGGELKPEEVTAWETGCFLVGIVSLILGVLFASRIS